MSVVWILFVCSIIVLPGIALLAFRWALKQGEFDNLQKTALSIFDEEEPVGRVTDHFPHRGSKPDGKAAPLNERSPTTSHPVPANSANAKL